MNSWNKLKDMKAWKIHFHTTVNFIPKSDYDFRMRKVIEILLHETVEHDKLWETSRDGT